MLKTLVKCLADWKSDWTEKYVFIISLINAKGEYTIRQKILKNIIGTTGTIGNHIFDQCFK